MPLPSPNSRTIPVFHSADGTEYPITNAGPLSAMKSPKILAQLDKMLYTVEFDDNQFGTLGFKRLNTTALLAVEDSGDCNGHDEIDWSSPSVASRVKILLTLSHDNIVGYRSLGCAVQKKWAKPRLAAILETSRGKAN
ncbi:hypothetical protein BV898_16321 [Hypsibius exemplaris]|uniref:Uncharacterized protein n=1 Tax=Hypsibius exemplaris TaxID=2072580 RepID=A0A9X6RL57_HYPEX|nr:hypothetical protein BV898_16321 [Hypsibius exemplaris]